jgi:nitrite reductase/ring-hydroxylating ferredoxin subunit
MLNLALSYKNPSSSVFDNREKQIDYPRIASLYSIGRYQRRLPVSINRMIENAYDWEHLPHVHKSSFQAIELVNQGDWGWQAITTQADARLQHIELLVDKPKNYWATTVLSGSAKGFEIHTHATEVTAGEIDISVNFYLPKSFTKSLAFLKLCKLVLPFAVYRKVAKKLGVAVVEPDDTPQASILIALQRQYSVLYDEDEVLMSGRQKAIDRRNNRARSESLEALSLGNQTDLTQQLPKVFEFAKRRYVLNRWKHEWVVYSAECPHLMGPLEDAEIDHDGQITCPWHGYKFDLMTGRNCSNDSAGLPNPPVVSVIGEELIVKPR